MKQLALIPSANKITADLLLAIPRRFEGARVWRRNVGVGVGMDTVKRAISLMQTMNFTAAATLLRSRPITFGIPGEPDIDGIIPINGYGVRLGIEVKTSKDRLSEAQINFGEMLTRAGGIHIVARSVEDCLDVLEQKILDVLEQEIKARMR